MRLLMRAYPRVMMSGMTIANTKTAQVMPSSITLIRNMFYRTSIPLPSRASPTTQMGCPNSFARASNAGSFSLATPKSRPPLVCGSNRSICSGSFNPWNCTTGSNASYCRTRRRERCHFRHIHARRSGRAVLRIRHARQHLKPPPFLRHDRETRTR